MARVIPSIAVVFVTIVVAAVSYRLVEQPIRVGRVATWLSARRMLVLTPAALLAASACVEVPAAIQESPEARTIMLTGDSVPKHMLAPLQREAASLGWDVVSASLGGCPATGDHVVTHTGPPGGKPRCKKAPAAQTALLQDSLPDVVVWWDRFTLADLVDPSGETLAAGTSAWWRYRQASIARTVERLGSTGATVVLVEIEPLGIGLRSRCTEERCNPWLRRQVERYSDLTVPWNDMLRRFARSHPTVEYVSITSAVCSEAKPLCDDRIDGVTAREDGSHYSGPGKEVAARALVREISRAVNN